jgi:hypothetical protein
MALAIRIALFASPVSAAFLIQRWIDGIRYAGLGRFASAAAFASQLDEWFRFSPYPLLEALVGQLVSPGRGLLLFFPLAWLAVRGLWVEPCQRVGAGSLWMGIIVVLVGLYSSFKIWWGGVCWGPRFLVPVAPLVTLAAAAWAASASGRQGRFRSSAFVVLSAIGTVITWSGILVDPNYYYYSWATKAFAVLPDTGGAQFRIIASPLVSAWAAALTTRPDLFWIHLWAPSHFPLVTQLGELLDQQIGFNLTRHSGLISITGCSVLLAVAIVVARRITRLVRRDQAERNGPS